MCMRACIRVCMRSCVRVCVCVCTRSRSHVLGCSNVSVGSWACESERVYLFVCAFASAHVCVSANVHDCVRAHVCVRACAK